MNLIHLRPLTPNDESFIYSSWLNSAREEFMHMSKKSFFSMYKIMVKEVLARSRVIIACDPEMHDHIFGYLIYKPVDDALILHWAYVKSAFRQKGVFDGMMEAALLHLENPIIITTETPVVHPYESLSKNAKKFDSITVVEANFKTARRQHILEKYKMIYKPEYRGI